ncbi:MULTISPECIES: invasion associated locus B family protein [Rhizobium/Agrobacterium group]|uniref:Invasion associated locus B family protein n=2 Tax=Neorhizobium TaxID=1525371 RepID=A0ABV0LXA0_9HYPH|nr:MULTISPECIES: invasion associated locus B family protein [Rhizobium/Agrobacterium group]KGD86026.1 invasion associated locus B family protein [Rhizobium sp. YS-1r]MCC2608800.1 invasion associated locus B family protein [Neorhizobium petrolearium]WGI69053.1 invasion associated locus B family protein [Neorhizobium petrolearium]
MGRPSLIRAGLAVMLAAATSLPAFAQQPGPRPMPQPSQDSTRQPAPQAAPSAPNGTGTQQPPAQKPQPPAGNVRENHGAWSIICDRPAGASAEQCALMQNVIAEDRPEVGLSVVVLKTADRKAKILRILAPLGVLLKDGMELYVDNNNIGRAYFTRCFSEGCYVEVEIDDELMRILRAGKNAVFALRESADQDRVGIPIELTGFGEGYDALP